MSKKISSILIAFVLLAGVSFSTTRIAFAYCIDDLNGNISDLSQNDCTEGFQWVDDSSDGSGKITTFGGLIAQFRNILDTIVPFLVALGVFVIIYGVFTYIRHSADEEKRDEAKKFVVWGVVGVFIMVSIWGLVNILVNSFDFQRNAPSVPSVFPTGEFE